MRVLISALLGSLLFVIALLAVPAVEAQRIQPMCQTGCLGGVQVTPDGGAQTKLPNSGPWTVEFEVTNLSSKKTYTFSCSPTGGITCVSVVPSSKLLNPDQTTVVVVTYNVGATGGQVGLVASATGASDDGYYLVTLQAGRGAAIRPELPVRQNFASTTGSQRFFVKNIRSVSTTYDLTAICTGSLSGCSVAPTSLTLEPGESKVGTLNYSVGTSGSTSSGWLKAIDSGGLTLPESAAVQITSVSAQYPLVSIVESNPGTAIERDQCLTIAAGSAAAFECGDLRIAHVLPSIRTMNRVRVPTILYSSGLAEPYPVVTSSVTLAAGSPLPDSVEAVLKVGGTPQATGRWAGSDWTAGSTRRIALAVPAR